MIPNLQKVQPGTEIKASHINALIDAIRACSPLSCGPGLRMNTTTSGFSIQLVPKHARQAVPSPSLDLVFSLKLSVGEEEAETVSVYVPEKIAPFVRTAINSENAPTINEFFVSDEYERSGDWLDLGELSGDIFAWLDPDSDSVKFTDDLSEVSDGAVSLRIGEISDGEATNSFLGVFSFSPAPDSCVPADLLTFASIGFTDNGSIQIHGFDGNTEGQMLDPESTEGLQDASGTILDDGKIERFDLIVRCRSDDGTKIETKYISKDSLARILGAHEVSIKDSEGKAKNIYVFHKKSDEEEEAEEADGGDGETSCEDEFPGNAGSGGQEPEYEFPRDGEEPFPGKSEKCW